MTANLFSEIGTNWLNNVFGSPLIAGIFILLFFTIFGIKQGWTAEIFAVVLVPLVAFASYYFLPPFIFVIVLITMGLIIAVAILKITGR